MTTLWTFFSDVLWSTLWSVFMNVPCTHGEACVFLSCWGVCSICLPQIKLVQIFCILTDFLSIERGMTQCPTLTVYSSTFFVILSIFTLGILKWCYEGHTSLKLLKLLVNCTFYPFIFNNTFFFPWKSNINVIMLAFFWLIFTWYIFLCYFAFLLSGAFSKKEVVWYRGKKYRL